MEVQKYDETRTGMVHQSGQRRCISIDAAERNVKSVPASDLWYVENNRRSLNTLHINPNLQSVALCEILAPGNT